MNRERIELGVGIFMLIGIIALGWITIKLGRMELLTGSGYYDLKAEFTNVGGLKVGASVEIGGVEIGRVNKIYIDPKNYTAIVDMSISDKVKIPDDSIAAIKTKGLIGEKFVEILPGASVNYLKPGEKIVNTQPAFSIEDAIGKYIFGGTGESSSSGSEGGLK
ncbi:MAG: outer membrane lipid asymmetry maintenance protein MlaD [Thermosulfidibacteraceae bacterium]|jgi:phospholipid/cholesterol/gamma-HCH transport system substrate-binding protein